MPQNKEESRRPKGNTLTVKCQDVEFCESYLAWVYLSTISSPVFQPPCNRQIVSAVIDHFQELLCSFIVDQLRQYCLLHRIFMPHFHFLCLYLCKGQKASSELISLKHSQNMARNFVSLSFTIFGFFSSLVDKFALYCVGIACRTSLSRFTFFCCTCTVFFCYTCTYHFHFLSSVEFACFEATVNWAKNFQRYLLWGFLKQGYCAD